MSFIYSAACSLFSRCCPRRNRPTTDQELLDGDRSLRTFQDETTTTAALARLVSVGSAHRTTGTAGGIVNVLRAQPAIVNTIEPVPTIIVRPITAYTFRNLLESQSRQATVMAAVIGLSAMAFGHSSYNNTYLLIGTIVASFVTPYFVEQFLQMDSAPLEVQINRLHRAQQGAMTLVHALNNHERLIQTASSLILAYIAYRRAQDPMTALDTSIFETSAIVAATAGLMPRTIGHLVRDLEAGVVRPVRNLARAGLVAQNVTSAPIQSLSEASLRERELQLRTLPNPIRQAYINLVRETERFATLTKSLDPTIRSQEQKAETDERLLELERAKPLDAYRGLTERMLSFFVSPSTEDQLRDAQAKAVAERESIFTASRGILEESRQSRVSGERLVTAAQADLNGRLENPTISREIRELVQYLQETRLSHHGFVARCDSTSRGIKAVAIGSAIVAGAAAAGTVACAIIGPERYRDQALGATIAGVKLAGRAVNTVDTAQKKYQKVTHVVTSAAANTAAKIVAPHISKFILNKLAPILLTETIAQINPECRFIARQIANGVAWVGFASLMRELYSTYTQENIQAAANDPLVATGANVVDFLVSTPRTPIECLLGISSHRETSREHAQAAYTELLAIAQEHDSTLEDRGTRALTRLIDLGHHTRILRPDHENILREDGIELAATVLSPVDQFIAAGNYSETRQTYAGAAAASIRAAARLAGTTERIGVGQELLIHGASYVAAAPLVLAERAIRALMPARQNPTEAALALPVVEAPQGGAAAAAAGGAAEAAPVLARHQTAFARSTQALWASSDVTNMRERILYERRLSKVEEEKKASGKP